MKIKLILIAFSLLVSYRLIRPGYFSMQDDIHVFRLQQFDQCLKDGQIPCRHIADGGLGYGYPLFNYYSPLPYAFAESFHLIGFSFIDSLKVSFIAPNFIRSISMFLLGNSFFGPIGGLISSALYTFAPYQAINGFVRGALAEHWALSLLPLVFWSLYTSKNNLFILSLSALFLSHNLTTFYTIPALIIFATLTKKFKLFLKNFIFSFLISAFFLLPAVFEKNLTTVNTMTQGYFYYIIHFATLYQLFISRFWGYGASLWGPKDDMSFQIGYLQWLIPMAIFIYTLLNKKIKFRPLILTFFSLGLFAIFLTHNKSTFIWQSLPFMSFYQFPWRFLGLVVFCFSFISGSITNLKVFSNHKCILGTVLIVLTILLNISFFKEDLWFPSLTDSQKLSPSEIYRQSGAGLKDYWPSKTSDFPTTMASSNPTASSGNIQTISFHKNSNSVTGQINVVSDIATVLLPVTDFPIWKLQINDSPSTYTIDPTYGQIVFPLKNGINNFNLSFTNTPIRTIANLVSLIGLLLYIIKLLREKHP